MANASPFASGRETRYAEMTKTALYPPEGRTAGRLDAGPSQETLKRFLRRRSFVGEILDGGPCHAPRLSPPPHGPGGAHLRRSLARGRLSADHRPGARLDRRVRRAQRAGGGAVPEV